MQVFKCINRLYSQGMDTLFDVSKMFINTIPGQPKIVVCLELNNTVKDFLIWVQQHGITFHQDREVQEAWHHLKAYIMKHYFENCINP